MSDWCWHCGRHPASHLSGGRCPLDIHVVIDADTLERVRQTGHPRLLKNLLAGTPQNAFAGVEITALRIEAHA